ncbi:VP1 structural protein [bat polyomavirus 4b]|uniref:VP1 structural protein n=1 Tax=bat polyomavirus 4b TaxID=2758138 RepID=J3TNZ2_9POLY|nr:VP1 structural protein [bat polyomavirus 4b]AFP94194.1 VP1 structural protein [bat polyomavirus 4b]
MSSKKKRTRSSCKDPAGACKTPAPKRVCVKKTSVCCPAVSCVPKLIVKGGVEVLSVVAGDDAITEIELYLNPRMGVNAWDIETYSNWYTFSYDVYPKVTLLPENLPTYSVARVSLPILNEDITCDTLQMWEAVSVKTELVGAGTLTAMVHAKTLQPDHENGAGKSLVGPHYHMFAVGGEPLDLQGMVFDWLDRYPQGEGKPITIEAATGHKVTPRNQGLDPTAKAKLNKDGYYPVELWSPDPSRNENSRYFGSMTTGDNTPSTIQFTNTLTTVLLDENGIGPLCKGDGLFVSCADMIGLITKEISGKQAWHGLPRYFNIKLRKRWVKNPYPVTNPLSSLFNNLMPTVSGQPMEGKDSQVEEVRIYQGMEPVPGDPDVIRYIDKYGQNRTQLPSNDKPAAIPVPPPGSLTPTPGPSCHVTPFHHTFTGYDFGDGRVGFIKRFSAGAPPPSPPPPPPSTPPPSSPAPPSPSRSF